MKQSDLPLVALLTDFGDQDTYVGVIKAEILKESPSCRLVDLTHKVPTQDVRAGAFHLRAAYRRFPEDAVFLAVVDPGVGTDRPILAAKAGPWYFVGPDNGLLSWVFNETRPTWVREVLRPSGKDISSTFHARDIMAPLAGRLAAGDIQSGLGGRFSEWETLPFPLVQKKGSRWEGEIISVDQYGNMITNFKTEDVKRFSAHSTLWMTWPGSSSSIRGLSESYAVLEASRPGLIEGSLGYVEIALKNGSAQSATGLKAGDALALEFKT